MGLTGGALFWPPQKVRPCFQTVANLLAVDGRFFGIERLRSLDCGRLWKR
jgi:hypothetical protein